MTMNVRMRDNRALLAAFCLTMLAACGAETAPAVAPPAAVAKPADNPAWPSAAIANPASVGFSAEGLAALDARLAKAVADQDVAGVVTVLAKGGEVVQFKAYGVQSGDPKTGAAMKPDTVVRIYSMTKPITGVAMMQLYEQGKWSLDDPVTKLVPELAGLKLMTGVKDGKAVLADPKSPPTMREIMSHTAGFGYGLSGDDPVNAAFRDQNVLASKDLDDMMAKVATIPLLYEPGERWSYSVAVDIQGYIVEKLSGQKLGDYFKANVLDPLGMTDTAFYVSETQIPRLSDVYSWNKDASALAVNPERKDRPSYTDPNRMQSGGGGLVSTAHDYARFCQMLLNKGELGGKRILKPETIALMAQNHIGDLGLYSDGTTANPGQPGIKFGLDFAVVDDPAAAKTRQGKGTYYWGGAAGTWFWVDPANDLFFVGMIQRMGPARPGGMDFRGESIDLVYTALSPASGD
jgi:CubicO group peptidase (beta-lactamase class C family)